MASKMVMCAVQELNQSINQSVNHQLNSGFLKEMLKCSSGFNVTMTAVVQDRTGL
jgi:hypothetical protein